MVKAGNAPNSCDILRHPLTTQGVCLIQKHASCCRRATATGVCVAVFSRRRAAGSPNTNRPSAVRSSSPACAETWAHGSLHTTAVPVGAMHWPHSLPGGFTNSQHYENTPLSQYIKHNKNTPVWACSGTQRLIDQWAPAGPNSGPPEGVGKSPTLAWNPHHLTADIFAQSFSPPCGSPICPAALCRRIPMLHSQKLAKFLGGGSASLVQPLLHSVTVKQL